MFFAEKKGIKIIHSKFSSAAWVSVQEQPIKVQIPLSHLLSKSTNHIITFQNDRKQKIYI